MIKISEKFHNSVAIVVVGYNRIKSMQRLLGSLVLADYPKKDVPLVISIDASGDTELYEYVNSFIWPYGEKIVNIQNERLGLKRHILQCGDLTEFFKGIILLEDDLFVSNCFYNYAVNALEAYASESRIAEISLYKNEVDGSLQLPKLFMNNGYDVFLSQSVVSWGQCWSFSMWKPFRDWIDSVGEINWDLVDIPDYMKRWNKAWSKFFNAYLTQTDKYVLMPNVSLTTNFSDAGENSNVASCIGQANLLCGTKCFTFANFDHLVKYDIYGNNADIYKWLNINKKNLYIAIWGNNKYKGQQYVLCNHTINDEDAKLISSYGFYMRPYELNIKYNIPGKEIFLYKVNDYTPKTTYPLFYANYFLREFNNKLLIKYSVKLIKDYIFSKFMIK